MYTAVAAAMESNKETNGKVNSTSRGPLEIVIGQCNTTDKYGHNYLDCMKCNVDKTLRCFIAGCPCLGQGFLFKVKDKENCFSHQMQGCLSSVRVYSNRPKRAIEAVQRNIDKGNCMAANPLSRSRKMKRQRGDDIDDIGKITNSTKKQCQSNVVDYKEVATFIGNPMPILQATWMQANVPACGSVLLLDNDDFALNDETDLLLRSDEEPLSDDDFSTIDGILIANSNVSIKFNDFIYY